MTHVFFRHAYNHDGSSRVKQNQSFPPRYDHVGNPFLVVVDWPLLCMVMVEQTQRSISSAISTPAAPEKAPATTMAMLVEKAVLEAGAMTSEALQKPPTSTASSSHGATVKWKLLHPLAKSKCSLQ